MVGLRHVPGGVEEYLRLRTEQERRGTAGSNGASGGPNGASTGAGGNGDGGAASASEGSASVPKFSGALTSAIRESQDELDELEMRWLDATEALEA
jgi:ATP-binding cassette subfamily F protein uup